MSIVSGLSAAEVASVRKRSLGAKRPFIFSATIAAAQSQARQFRTTNPDDLDPMVQISPDMEAALILLPGREKSAILTFLAQARNTRVSDDERQMLQEVFDARGEGYALTNQELGAPILAFDQARTRAISFLEGIRLQEGVIGEENDALVAEVSSLFSLLAQDYESASNPDTLATHDRIADAGALFRVQGAGDLKAREIASWEAAISLYL